MEFRLIYRKSVNTEPPIGMEILSSGNGIYKLVQTIYRRAGNSIIESQGSAEKIKKEFNLIINQANEKRERYAKDKELQAQEI